MKSMKFLFITIVLLSSTFFLRGQGESEQLNQDSKVSVYYFHNERRCVTCLAVEKESKEIVKSLYNDRVEYKVYNLDGERGKAQAKKLGIAMQSLLVVKGDKIENLTVDAFRFAKSNPEKLKAIMKEKIDDLL